MCRIYKGIFPPRANEPPPGTPASKAPPRAHVPAPAQVAPGSLAPAPGFLLRWHNAGTMGDHVRPQRPAFRARCNPRPIDCQGEAAQPGARAGPVTCRDRVAHAGRRAGPMPGACRVAKWKRPSVRSPLFFRPAVRHPCRPTCRAQISAIMPGPCRPIPGPYRVPGGLTPRLTIGVPGPVFHARPKKVLGVKPQHFQGSPHVAQPANAKKRTTGLYNAKSVGLVSSHGDRRG